MEKISYFSYKGGSGRSSLVYNTLPLLAKQLNASSQRPLIVMDMDIDSAGLSFLFRKNMEVYRELNRKDPLYVQSIFSGNIPDSRHNKYTKPNLWDHLLIRSLVPIGNIYDMDERAILFLPANTTAGQKQDIETEDSYSIRTELLGTVINVLDSYDCCGIVFDCPTGRQSTAQASLKASDKIVTVMRITKQFRDGTYSHLEWFDPLTSDKTFIIVPNAVPHDDIKFDGVPFNYNVVKDEIQGEISRLVQQNDVDFSLLEGNNFGVPEVIRFKFQEDILVKRAMRTPDEEAAVSVYRILVDALTK